MCYWLKNAWTLSVVICFQNIWHHAYITFLPAKHHLKGEQWDHDGWGCTDQYGRFDGCQAAHFRWTRITRTRQWRWWTVSLQPSITAEWLLSNEYAVSDSSAIYSLDGKQSPMETQLNILLLCPLFSRRDMTIDCWSGEPDCSVWMCYAKSSIPHMQALWVLWVSQTQV